MTAPLFFMVVGFLFAIALLLWEVGVTRRERDEARAGMTEWYEAAWKERRKRERAELGYRQDVPDYLFPLPADHETVMRRIMPRINE